MTIITIINACIITMQSSVNLCNGKHSRTQTPMDLVMLLIANRGRRLDFNYQMEQREVSHTL